MSDPETVARAYYEAIDDGRYEKLRTLLGTDFLHDRPDRGIEGPDEFVRFMREERPLTATTHEIDSCYRNGSSVAIQGRLHRDGETLFAFVDVHAIEDERIARLRTYTE